MNLIRKKLGEVAKIIMGQSPPSSTYNESGEGLPFYQGKKDYGDINPTVRIWCSVPGKIVEAGDILISVRAPVGALNIASERSCIGRGLSGIRAGKYLDQGFLYHFLRGKEIEIASWGTGSTFASISKKHLENIEIPLPPIAEQRRIVEKMEKQFAKIDEAARLRAESEAATAALLPAALHEIFSQSESKGWGEKTIEDLALEIKSGFACGKSNEVPDGIVHLRTHNIALSGELNLDKIVRIPEKFVDTKVFTLRKGDIIFNNTNSRELVGKTIIIRDDLPYAFSNHLTRIRLNTNIVMPEWILQIFQLYWRDKVFEKMCTKWIGQAGINQTALKKIKIPLPPLAEQKKIVKKLDALSEKVRALRELQLAQSADLKALKQSILHEAFAGKR